MKNNFLGGLKLFITFQFSLTCFIILLYANHNDIFLSLDLKKWYF